MKSATALSTGGVLLLTLSACTKMPELEFNEPPEPGEIAITPLAPSTLEDLRWELVSEPSDPDGDDLSVSVEWTVDGTYSAMGEVVPATVTRKGQLWRVKAVARDGEWTSDEFFAQVVILNTPPVLESGELEPAAPSTNDDLFFRYTATDQDDDDVQVSLRWARDGVPVDALDDERGVPASQTLAGEVWELTATPWDDQESGNSMVLATKVENSAPELDQVLISPQSPGVEDGVRLSLVQVSDPDGDTLSTTVQWYLDEVLVETDVVSGGSTTTDLDAGFARGQHIYAKAWVSDGFLDSPVRSSETLLVANTVPRHDSCALDAAQAFESSTVRCVPSTAYDADGDATSWIYDWRLDGSTWLGLDSQAVDGGDFDKGDTLQCRAAPHDGIGQGDWQLSESLVVSNTPPVLSSLTLSESAPTVTQSVSVSVSSSDIDPGDTVSLSYAWVVEGSSVSSSSSLNLGAYARGDKLYVSVTPSDGSESGAALTSSTLTIANSVPSISGVSLSPGAPSTSDSLTASPSGYYDADGDSGTYTYAWTVNGSSIASSDRQLDYSNYVKGDVLRATVRPSDGIASGASVNSGSVTVKNTAPVASVSASATLAESCDVVVLDASGSTDADSGDTLSYAWSIVSKPSGSKAGTANFDDSGAEMPEFQLDAAGTFSFSASVSDGSSSSTDAVSVTATLRASNTDPVADGGSDSTYSQSVACTSTGYGLSCPNCDNVSIDLDSTASTDADGDYLATTWNASTDNGSVSIADPSASTTILTVSGLPAEYGLVLSYDVTVTLGVTDCAAGSDLTTLTYTIDCEGY